jgi:phosphatidylinositol alpha-1,6-mannosyltransferase
VDRPPRGREPRLLILTPDYPPAAGGIQVTAHRLATRIQGCSTLVLAPDAPGAAAYDQASTVAMRRTPGAAQAAARNAALNAWALGAALRFRPHVTLSMHIASSPAAAAIRRTLGARTLQYFHAEEVGARPRLAAFAARQAHVVIAVSAYTAELVRATGAPVARLAVVHPGVDSPADPSPQAETRPTCLTISRLQERYKGHDVMIRALALVRARVPSVRWVVIGDGPLRPALEALAASHGVRAAVDFRGAVPDEERDGWLRRTHLLAMPSRLPPGGLAGEGFGIVYLEAGAFAKPVVAGRAGGALDAVLDGVTGLLVDPTDPVEVADAITRLLSDGELAARLGRAGAERARELTWARTARHVQDLLEEQLGAR